MQKEITKIVLTNSVKYNGKASVGSVVGALMQEKPELKSKIKELMKDISKEVARINKLSLEAQKKELDSLGGAKKIKKRVEIKGLKPLKNVGKKFVMRFEPSPSGPLHIGHAFVGSLNAAYCKMYKGKFIVRVSDTNPENIYVPAYRLIKEDAEWLWGKVEYYIQSDRMDIYYDYVNKFLNKDSIYVCTCDSEAFRKLINNKEACPCRALTKKENKERWQDMLSGKYKTGEAVVRFKSSITHKNPAMRDFPLLRINKTKHPRQGRKYNVWPLMNFSVMVDDLTTGVTHSIRGKDHADNEKRQRMMFDVLGKKAPEALFVGRINFEGFEVSCSKTKVKIEKGKYAGWDDVRIPFIPALRKRGYLASSFVKYAEDVGVSLNDKTVHIDEFFKILNYFNRVDLDEIAKRYFFVEKPKKIRINKIIKRNKEIVGGKYNEEDFEKDLEIYITDKIEKGKYYRLMNLFNFKAATSKRLEFVGWGIDPKLKAKKIQWVQFKEEIEIGILMDTGKWTKGMMAKSNLKTIKIGEVIQFERFGFCRKDTAKKFIFTHR